MEVVARLMRLFDVGRSIMVTLDEKRLRNVIVNRARTALEVKAAYL